MTRYSRALAMGCCSAVLLLFVFVFYFSLIASFLSFFFLLSLEKAGPEQTPTLQRCARLARADVA